MGGLTKKIEVGANVAIIALALLIGGVLVKRYLAPEGQQPPETVRVGDRLNLSGVDWAGNRRTLLLILQTDCIYCTESIPFYQRLSRELKDRRGTRLIAVFPQPAAEGQAYLQEHGVSVDEVRQEKFASIRVGGTPTLLLIDQIGAVSDVWKGKLPAAEEAEVLSRLQIGFP